jgi:LytS/YehU family sensor histidine kinase
MRKHLFFLSFAIVMFSSVYSQVNDTSKQNIPDSNTSISDTLTSASFRKQQILVKELQKTINQYQEQAEMHNNSVSLIFFWGLVLLFIFLLFGMIGLTITKRRETRNIRKISANALKIQNLENEKRENILQQRTAELEMQALRAQMNPHFIFNCLNAINHFILVNEVNTASDYLTKFSRLIRIVLDNSFRKNIFLSEELESLRLYIELEQIRFDHHFSYEISFKEVSDIDDIVIPPMLLQPFVENAIWHGLMYKDGSGILNVEIKRENEILICSITDNGIGRKRSAELKSSLSINKKSLGMNITASRLHLLNEGIGNQIGLQIIDLLDSVGQSAGTRVIITIPIKKRET